MSQLTHAIAILRFCLSFEGAGELFSLSFDLDLETLAFFCAFILFSAAEAFTRSNRASRSFEGDGVGDMAKEFVNFKFSVFFR